MKVTSAQVIQGLLERNVPAHVAQGVAMNFADESSFNTGAQERGHKSGRGGFGLAQWTGPRRVALEQFAKAQGRPATDLDLQLDFFMQENAGPEAKAWNSVLAAASPQDAAVRFLTQWERPAAEHAAARTSKYLEGAPAPTPAARTETARVATTATQPLETGVAPIGTQAPSPASVQAVFDALAGGPSRSTTPAPGVANWGQAISAIQNEAQSESERALMENAIADEDAINRGTAVAQFFGEEFVPELVLPPAIDDSINRYLAQL